MSRVHLSRRTHGLVALLATGAVVALLVTQLGDSGADPAGHRTAPTPSPLPSVTTSSGAVTAETDPTGATPSSSAPTSVVPGATITPCERSGTAVPLTVVTFNIHHAAGRNGLQLDLVAAEIAASEPDVVLLQEVDDGRPRSRLVDEAAYLAEALRMSHEFAPNVRRYSGTAVLTRLPVESSTHTRLPNRPGRQPRGLQHLVLRLKGHRISVYNSHLDHTTPPLRQAQMRAARDIIGVDPLPVIFGGDFNASPSGATMRLALDPAHSDLVDPWPLVGDGNGLTVPNTRPRSRIDFLLADEDWRPTVMATWQSAVSDHRGVVGRFLLRKPRQC